jgi:TonB family protein
MSASVHVVAILFLAALARVAPGPALPRAPQPVTFVMMAVPVLPHELAPTPTLTLPVVAAPQRPAPIAITIPEAPPAATRPLARSEPGPAPPEAVRPALVAVAAPPVPVRAPVVTVGLFADNAPTVHEAEPAKAVRATGFDAPSPTGRSGETKSAAAVGGFDQSIPAATARVARAGAPVESAGFGSSRAGAPAKPAGDVRLSGFDAVRPSLSPAPRPAPPADRIDVPVEILFKPAPAYTEEARVLKLEGDVLLEVEFTAVGAVSVLRVVRGLGHGLDESATQAAAQIRFKPAQSGGRSIAFRTTVHILFRLA